MINLLVLAFLALVKLIAHICKRVPFLVRLQVSAQALVILGCVIPVKYLAKTFLKEIRCTLLLPNKQ